MQEKAAATNPRHLLESEPTFAMKRKTLTHSKLAEENQLWIYQMAQIV